MDQAELFGRSNVTNFAADQSPKFPGNHHLRSLLSKKDLRNGRYRVEVGIGRDENKNEKTPQNCRMFIMLYRNTVF